MDTKKIFPLLLLMLFFLVSSISADVKRAECPISKYVVGSDKSACFQTIQEAVDTAAASGGGTVFVKPGRYVENLDLRMLGESNVTILGAVALGDEGQCEIVGTHIPPITGSVVLRNFKLTGEQAIFKSEAKGKGHLVIMDAYLNVGNGYTFDVPNWTGILEVFDVNKGNSQDGGIRNKGGASIFVYNAGLGNGTELKMIVSGPLVAFCACIGCPIKAIENAQIYIDNTLLLGSIITRHLAHGAIANSRLVSGSNTAIIHNSRSILAISDTTIESSANNAIEGVGEIKLGSVTFMDSSNIIGVQLNTAASFRSGTIIVDELNVRETKENKKIGTATLENGKAIVYTDGVKQNSRILLTPQSWGGEPGFIGVSSKVVGESFTIVSSSFSDQSTIAWFIIDSADN